MTDNKNLIMAVVISTIILLGFEAFWPKPAPVTTAAPQTATGETMVPTLPVDGQIPAPGAPVAGGTAEQKRADALKTGNRLRIETPRLHGSISLVGARIDDLTLADYTETLDPNSAEIVLLSPKGADNAYYAEYGWTAAAGATVPTSDTVWSTDAAKLTPDAPVTLYWDNGEGLRFERTIAIDDNYMFAVTQRVINQGAQEAVLYPYGFLTRRGTPEIAGFYILHEGPLGVIGGTLKELDYDDLREKTSIEEKTTGGWLGITDKYWLAALVPDQNAEVRTRFVHSKLDGVDRYQADYLGAGVTIPAGGQAESTSHLFAGAKEIQVLDAYEAKYQVHRFDLAIDFGWFYFLTKPIFYGLLFLNEYVGNLGVAILLLTVAVKLLFFPLANKSYRAMNKMKQMGPEVQKLRERFGDDKMRINQEMMALYKREKVSPAAGCLPILAQIPVFFALYKVLFVTIEMRHAPFFGWIHDLSAPDPLTVVTLFGLIPWEPPSFLAIGIWPVIMGATMYLQQSLNPPPPDPVQAKIFKFLPLIFTFMLGAFPAGLVIYWAWNNILSILQQWTIMKRMEAKP